MPKGKLRGRVAAVALGAWFASMVGLSTVLLAKHTVPLPAPAREDTTLSEALQPLSVKAAGRMVVVHVLYSECPCSVRLMDHLLTTSRPTDVAETILLVGSSSERDDALGRKGFDILHVTPEQLEREWHVKAVPLLIVATAKGVIQYSGGYTRSKQGPDPRDLDIIAAARAGGNIGTLPVFGCAVAADLRRQLDPTGEL